MHRIIGRTGEARTDQPGDVIIGRAPPRLHPSFGDATLPARTAA